MIELFLVIVAAWCAIKVLSSRTFWQAILLLVILAILAGHRC